jgi:isoleucyl-tRNA synthetase
MHDDLDARDPRAMVRRLAGFCSGDLGSWYDMRKDSLYCDREDSLRRRGVCTAMEEVFSSLVAWLGPLAPFAADEAWRERHGATAPDASLSRWPDRRAPDPVVTGRFAVALRLRSSFLSRAEPLQRAGTLGSPSEAVAVVRLSPADAASLEGVDLASVLGAAAAEATADAATSVDVRRSAGCRCVRCRRTLPEVPTGGLCRRCEEVAR